ncbi:hypothetical protein SAMN04487926_13826 [Paraburkholderia steynii]|uniref:Uncharacterized protein n=2 Tax=Paraburkholderia steynii TaxID=1245441 RepID=A0A7Z7BH24_9BURK|nr:hypothetical protein SAMN04487926_13826 [Paraburkholderia steynii]
MTARGYPKSYALRRGVILRAAVHTTMLASEPALGGFLAWDGTDYVLNNADGTYAAITFDGSDIVGVFFDAESSYNPYVSGGAYDIEIFFRGMPPRLRSLAERHALAYNRQNYQCRSMALITAAFWSVDDYLTAAFPWEDVFRHGAHIVRVELLGDTDEAWQEWREAYQCSPGQLAAARALFWRDLSK